MLLNNDLSNVLQKLINLNKVPFLLGYPGIGKSSFIEEFAKTIDAEYFLFACNQFADKSDITGIRMLQKKINGVDEWVQESFPHRIFVEAISAAEKNPKKVVLLFMDEINRTTADVTSLLLSIPTARQIANKRLPENLKIIAAGNDKGNIAALDDASTSRFVILRGEPDAAYWMQITENVHPAIKNVLTKHPELILSSANKNLYSKQAIQDPDKDEEDTLLEIEDMFDESSITQFATPRTISAINEFLLITPPQELAYYLSERHIVDQIDMSFLEELIIGHTGYTEFSKQLLAEITTSFVNNLSIINPANAINTPKMPDVWKKLKAATTVSELDEHLQNTNDKEKSEILVYALYNSANNKLIIDNVLDNLKSPDKTAIGDLTLLHRANMLNPANVLYASNTKTPIGQMLAMTL